LYFDIADVAVPLWQLLAWGGLVGFVFSTVGAAGGILASVGLISVFGIGNPNLVKPMAQAMTLITPLIAVPLYMRQCRVVFRLSFLLGAGGVLGALLGSSLSVNLLSDMGVFRPVFAVLVFFIAAQLAWQIFHAGRRSSELTRTMRAAEAFERQVRRGGELCDMGVECRQFTLRRVVFGFGDEVFEFSPWLPFATGMGIAVLSSALGVGGGFLLVPFMSIVMRHAPRGRAGSADAWHPAGRCGRGLCRRARAEQVHTGERPARLSRACAAADRPQVCRTVLDSPRGIRRPLAFRRWIRRQGKTIQQRTLDVKSRMPSPGRTTV
jgi:uncharacterized membrane protein YfcA